MLCATTSTCLMSEQVHNATSHRSAAAFYNGGGGKIWAQGMLAELNKGLQRKAVKEHNEKFAPPVPYRSKASKLRQAKREKEK